MNFQEIVKRYLDQNGSYEGIRQSVMTGARALDETITQDLAPIVVAALRQSTRNPYDGPLHFIEAWDLGQKQIPEGVSATHDQLNKARMWVAYAKQTMHEDSHLLVIVEAIQACPAADLPCALPAPGMP